MQRAEFESWKPVDVARLLALVEAERRYYQLLLEELPVAVAVAGDKGELRAANRAFRLTFSLVAGDVGRTTLDRLFPGAPVREWAREVIESGKPVEDCEVLVGQGDEARRFFLMLDAAPVWQHGAQREVLVTVIEGAREEETPAEAPPAEPPKQESGKESRPGVSRREIGQAKRAALERLAARVAHVANNLLMIIGGYGEEILESLPEGDVRRAGMAEILRAAERLGRLTKDLNALTVAREFEAAAVPLAGWMREAAPRLAEYRIRTEGCEPGLCAMTSPELLEQVLQEAARYLLPALGEEGKLHLRARALDDRTVELRLAWAGAEVSEEMRERFFEPFSGEKAGTDPPLGLAGWVKSWEKLGGAMELEGDALVLVCPRAPDAAPGESPLLLVDDEPGIRSLVARALERAGFAVVQAASAQEALEAWQSRQAPPRLLVTDLTLPGMPGNELAARLRLRWPEMPVLFISGYTGDARLAADAAGGRMDERTRFLHKPFTTGQLLEEVRRLLG
jgi:CheY-like chemotaxis protein/signal transduction histidine kinase